MESTLEGNLAEPRLIHQSASIILTFMLSCSGDLLVIGSTEHSGTLQTNLLALDTRHGQRISELGDGPESSLSPGPFSPIAGDDRMLATTDHSGVARPIIWNPRTNERTDLAIDALEGEVLPS